MSYKVQVREQVKQFYEARAPDTRQRIRKALRGLEEESGNILPLRERLSGYCRLRIGAYRIIFRYQRGRIIECVFAEERSMVYHLFEKEFLERLRQRKG
jgi:mRNA-degrading endonuclease RelE of RelBE toxin-antitoxin system